MKKIRGLPKLRNNFNLKLFYIVCLIPVNLLYNVNYLFASLYIRKRFRKINDIILRFFVVYVPICYLLGFLTAISFSVYAIGRHFISFGIYFIFLCLLFIEFNEKKIRILLDAVIIIAVMYASWVLLVILFNPHVAMSINDIRSLKEILRLYHIWGWPQYNVPVLIFALLLLLPKLSRKVTHYFAVIVLLTVIIFTGLRAAYLALFVGFFSYIIVNILKMAMLRSFEKRFLHVLSGVCMFALIALLFLWNTAFFDSVLYLIERGITTLEDFFTRGPPTLRSDNLRYEHWRFALNQLWNTNSLLHGSGFIGIYVWNNNTFGSLDSQFINDLFRMGLIGTCFVLYCFAKIIRFFYRYDTRIFSCMLALLTYGFFHTTYQSPYIGFIFFALLSFADSQSPTKGKRKHRVLQREENI